MTASQASTFLPSTLPAITKHLTQDKIIRYGQTSGDLNPIHLDPVAAEAYYGSTIAHGMLVLAYISEAMTAAFGLNWLGSGRLRVRFRAVARPGDSITTDGNLKAIDDANDRWQAIYSLEARNQRGEVLISGQAEVEVPKKNEVSQS